MQALIIVDALAVVHRIYLRGLDFIGARNRPFRRLKIRVAPSLSRFVRQGGDFDFL